MHIHVETILFVVFMHTTFDKCPEFHIQCLPKREDGIHMISLDTRTVKLEKMV